MRYVFEDCELDLQRYELRRAGVPLSLSPKIFEMLLYLIRHRHRVVSKQELLSQVWPTHFVSDTSLARCISTIRKAIDPNGHAKAIIKTLYGRGYRFILPVEEQGSQHIPDRHCQVPVLSAELTAPPGPGRHDGGGGA